MALSQIFKRDIGEQIRRETELSATAAAKLAELRSQREAIRYFRGPTPSPQSATCRKESISEKSFSSSENMRSQVSPVAGRPSSALF
jgi:hypothetical protein